MYLVAVPFEDLLKAQLEPQLHIEGQLNYIAGAKKTNQGLWTQDLIRVKSFLQIFLPTSPQVQGSETPLWVDECAVATLYIQTNE